MLQRAAAVCKNSIGTRLNSALVAQWIVCPPLDLQGSFCGEFKPSNGDLAWRRARKPEITLLRTCDRQESSQDKIEKEKMGSSDRASHNNILNAAKYHRANQTSSDNNRLQSAWTTV
ncbi:hypothetical protein PoB_002793100 [Plakobranchus ocellatus]|uniref:Uncharacterized protein n=1 Tax=Plakobranchus ocellatus TaxID=259542 RepID=A0AAV4A419_9GAST|nr:hypothetical protein PoB_002793100 [Plakobranchus ocellatus]